MDLYQRFQYQNETKQYNALKYIAGKEKMLLRRIFSFSHYVFLTFESKPALYEPNVVNNEESALLLSSKRQTSIVYC